MHELNPSVRENVDNRRPSDLRLLGDLPGRRVIAGEPDIRGWSVFDREREMPIGAVEELLVSADSGHAVFIVLNTGEVVGDSDVDYGIHGHLANRRILVPRDRLEFDIPDSRVLFAGSLHHLHCAPEYDPVSGDFGLHYDYWSAA